MKLANSERNIAHAALSGEDGEDMPEYTGAYIANGNITATNGCIIATCPIADSAPDDDREWLIPANALLPMPTKRGKKFIEIEPYGSGAVAIHGETTVLAKLINKQFLMSIERIKEKSNLPGEEPIVIGFNPTLLRQLLKIVGEEPMIKLRIHAENTCVEFKAGDISGLIMPMSTNGWDE